jgi:hypothetical protein
VDLRGYQHALPASLTSVGGSVYLEGGSMSLAEYRAKYPAPTATVQKRIRKAQQRKGAKKTAKGKGKKSSKTSK